jgi:hypothetical protein
MVVVWEIDRLRSAIISIKPGSPGGTLKQFIQTQAPSHLTDFNPSGR